MTLQEKIDKLSEIQYKDDIYRPRFGVAFENVIVEYYCINPYKERQVLIHVGNQIYNETLSRRLENAVDTTLRIIENKEYEKP